MRSRTIITDTMKYTINEGDIPELYKLQSDPYELDNLAGDAGAGPIEHELGAMLGLLRKQHADTVEFTPGGCN